MSTVKLTKDKIGKINAPDPSGKQMIHWDTELAGFGLLVSGKTESKTFIAQRRLPDGRTRRVTVGAVGEFEKVEEARSKAGRLLLELREGKDPKAERRRAAARTLRGTLDLYLKSRKDLRERTVENYRHAVERHLNAWLDRPLREITPEMVEEKHAAIGKEAGPAAATGAMRAFRALWNFALDRDGTMPANPVRRLKRAWYALPPRERMVRADELPAFYKAIENLPSRTHRDYLLLLLFTGLRRREAAAMQWSEVDFAERVIRLPARRTKGGRRLDLPMSDFVRDLLVVRRALGNDTSKSVRATKATKKDRGSAAEPSESNPLSVFPADSKSGHIEEPKFPLQQVAKATGIAVSAHDLRRTFVTIAEGSDISPLALKALVNHALGNDVTSAYVRLTVDRLREPAQRVCDRLKALCKIEEPAVEKIGSRL
jgi:integrase